MTTITTDAKQLAAYVNTTPDSFIDECLSEATALVSKHVGDSTVPTAVLDRAVLEVGADLYHRRKARNGVTAFEGGDGGEPVRISRNPMLSAYPILRPFLRPGIA